jgi:flagellar biosynthesis protein FlhF
MAIYVERGRNRGDCCHKFVKKYGPYFTILREKTIPAKFFGLIPETVEVEFNLPPLKGFSPSGATQGASAPGSPQGTLVPGGGVTPVRFPNNRQTGSAGREAAASVATAAGAKDDSTIDFIEEKRRWLTGAGKDPDLLMKQIQDQDGKESDQQKILEKLQKLEEKIDSRNAPKPENPNLTRIMEILRLNDFSLNYCARMIDRARREMPLETLENFDAAQARILEWIGESIRLYHMPDRAGNRRIMVLVGPTGVGKTTTVAKLAAIYARSERYSLSVRLITIDAFRIGAREQIEHYGDIMEIPVSYVDNKNDLRREIDLYWEGADLILIDTIGKSPKDSMRLGEMKEMLDVCGSKAEVHLVLSASTKTSDIEHTLRQFEPFGYQAILLTKLDETRHVGNIISALAEKGKPLSYITDGQDVPKDIRKADIVRFLINLDEFRIDREALEKRFPAADTDQFQWG